MNRPDPTINAEFLTIHGSRAYGLDRPDSDWDYRGFFMPSAEHLLGFMAGPEQHQVQVPKQLDVVAWEIRKFFRLAASANPNVIEVLFTDPSDHIIAGPYAEQVLANKYLFLSKRARDTFGGYAVSQLKKTRTANWADEGARKDGMHLLRLLHFGIDILTHGKLEVRMDCHQADDLLLVRQGHYTREEVIKSGEGLLNRLDASAEKSPLPDQPPLDTLNGILIDIMHAHLKATT